MRLKVRTVTTGPLQDERIAARLGIALGVCFATAFVTGLFSHLLQHPGPFPIQPRPAGLYRVTEGVHVITGVAVVPLLAAKLWAVYPKFWDGLGEMRERLAADLRDLRARRRPAGARGTVALGVRRLAIVPLTGSAIIQVVTGLTNIAYWYPWPFFFTTTHYWTAFTLTGALVVHVAGRWETTRRAVGRPLAAPPEAASAGPVIPRTRFEGSALRLRPGRMLNKGTSRPPGGPLPENRNGAGNGPSRRGFLTAAGAASAILVTVMAGETVTPVRGLALLAPRRSGHGQAGVPVNRTAAAAGIAVPAAYRLRVRGAVPEELTWTLPDLRALPQHTVTLPIACVEGWSVSARWTGVRVRDLLRVAGAADEAAIRVESLERGGRYRASELTPAYWHDPDTLLALRCDGEELTPDHGYPVRLIAGDRPGVLQTKWVSELVVTA